MAFNPTSLPRPVYEAYKMGVGAWPLVVDRAIQAGITDANVIGNIVFYMFHPDRIGYPLQTGETALIQEWKAHRDYAKARIANPTLYLPNSVPSGPVISGDNMPDVDILV